MMNIDANLWNDFINGKEYALPQIFNQNVQLLFRYGKKFTQNDDLIKDTIQDLFFDLIKSRSNLGKTDSILFYLMRSFRRKLVKNIQKNIIGSNSETFKTEPAIVYSIEEELIEKEELDEREKLIHNALKELSDRQREIIFYRFYCGFNYDQICEIMSLKYDSARKQMFRSLQLLRKYLTEKEIVVLLMGTIYQF